MNTQTISMNVRIPVDVLERLEWLAASRGSTRPALIRNALYHVSKDAKPPAEAARVASDKLPALKQIAAARNMNAEQLLNAIVDRLIERFAQRASPD